MNARKPLVLALVPAFLLLAFWEARAAPRWVVRIGEPSADYVCTSIEQTPDGGCVLVGARDHAAWCAKLDALGNVLWQHRSGGAGYSFFNDVCALSDGSCFITGRTTSSGAGEMDLWCLLLGAAGNVIWEKTYGGSDDDSGSSGRAVSGGGFIVAGTTESFDEGRTHVFCMKLDASGGVVWTKLYGKTDQEQWPSSIQQTADGGFVFTGGIWVSAGDLRIWCVKTDSSGNITWQRGYGGGFSLLMDSKIQQTSDGGYILRAGGYTGGDGQFYILKLTPTGNITWQKYTSELWPAAAKMNDIRQTGDGGYVVAGQLHTGDSDDPWFVKLDSNGVITWQKSAGGSESAGFNHVRVTADGGLLFAGGVDPSDPEGCIFVSRHSSTGDIDASCGIQQPTGAILAASLAAAPTSALTWPIPGGSGVNSSFSPIPTPAVASVLCSSPAVPDLSGAWSNIRFKRSKLNGTLTCTNAGAAAVGSFSVKVYFSKKPKVPRRGTPFKTQNLGGLAPFGSQAIAIRATPGSKDKYIIAVLDSANTVAEEDEANNTVVWKFR